LVTGHQGYIGAVMAPVLQAAGHEVRGVDTGFFAAGHGEAIDSGIQRLGKDIRDLEPHDFNGIDAVVHLAALSNDPLGEINPAWTREINLEATVRLAELAKGSGVQRFLFASSCSVYGLGSEDAIATETSPLRPLTEYALSKIRAEEALAGLADDDFSPVYLRNATVYGWSPRFRADLVVNNLTAWAFTTGEIRILSDGTPWRPVVHVQDVAQAFAAALTAPRPAIHNQAFNVGRDGENYQIRALAAVVHQVMPDCHIHIAGGGRDFDPRSYRVDFSKLSAALPAYQPSWNVRRGVEELLGAYQGIRLTEADFKGPKYVRLARLKALLEDGRLDETLRWRDGS
jgi:nucleoside-diphosphate-sugar epimerase